jgi:hypothetical protein
VSDHNILSLKFFSVELDGVPGSSLPTPMRSTGTANRLAKHPEAGRCMSTPGNGISIRPTSRYDFIKTDQRTGTLTVKNAFRHSSIN